MLVWWFVIVHWNLTLCVYSGMHRPCDKYSHCYMSLTLDLWYSPSIPICVFKRWRLCLHTPPVHLLCCDLTGCVRVLVIGLYVCSFQPILTENTETCTDRDTGTCTLYALYALYMCSHAHLLFLLGGGVAAGQGGKLWTPECLRLHSSLTGCLWGLCQHHQATTQSWCRHQL